MRGRGATARRSDHYWRGILLLVCTPLAFASGMLSSAAAGAGMQFGGNGTRGGEFAEPTGVAVHQSDGDVYVGDEGNNRAEQFSATGVFVRTWGFGVSDGLAGFETCVVVDQCLTGIAGAAGGQFIRPNGIAIDNSPGVTNGQAYVEDPHNNRIERFGPSGEFILTFGGAVNKTAQQKGETANEDVCPVNPGDECQAGTPGPGPSQFESLGRSSIAVGPTGTVYIGDGSRVQKFSAAGAPEGEVALAETGLIEGLVVDSSADMYVLRQTPEGVRKYDGAGKELGEARDPEIGGFSPSIALGPSDELIVSDPEKQHVFVYDPSGTQLESLFLANAEGASGGIAFGETLNTLYILYTREHTAVRTLSLPPPGPVVLEGSTSASEVLPTAATLNARINPEGPEEAHYHFEYGTTTAYGQSTAEEPLTPGFEDQAASASISGLQPRTLYHFRAVATNALNQTTFGEDQTFTTLPPVSIESESSAEVTTESAKLIAELNPHGVHSEYHFEYGINGYEHSAPVPDGDAGEGTQIEAFSVRIQGLSPKTLYHYRVVAHNELGTVEGPDRTFITQGGEPIALPDDRAWEMVSPPLKHGNSLEAIHPEGSAIKSAADGSAFAYVASGPIDEEPKGNRSAMFTQLVAKRTGAGVWSTEDIATPHQAPAGFTVNNRDEYKQFSSDLSSALVAPAGATRLDPENPLNTEATPYRREADGSYTPLVTAGNVAPGVRFGGKETVPEGFLEGLSFQIATDALNNTLIVSPISLLGGFESGGLDSIYEWSEGKLQLASVLPNKEPAAAEGHSAFVGFHNAVVRTAINQDGQRVFFGTESEGRLYMRDITRKETLRIDAAEAGVKEAAGGATFQIASGDGSKVFFTDANRLTKDATAKGAAPELYECTIVEAAGKLTCQLKDLSANILHPGEAADVQGIVPGASEDGRYVYFAAKGALEEGASSGACPDASEGQCVNLYAYDTQAQSRRLVAVLAEADAPSWETGGSTIDEATSRAAPNGRYFAFMSERPLTGFDNRDANPTAKGARDEEVFIYDYASKELRCASCDPSGQRPKGQFDSGVFPGLLVDRAALWQGHWLAASIPGWTRVDVTYSLYQSRYLSNSGRLFFDSPVGLVGADVNGQQDVYEYEPTGVGSCGEPQGCVGLISSGSASEETAFLDASESGDDVFFLTPAQLSKADQDNALDVYDAHVCTLAPGCAPEAIGQSPPCITADACRSAPTPQPGAFSAPASASFSGAGNLAPPTVKPKPKVKPTRAQLLAKALKSCRKKHNRAKRSACERQARKRYGPIHKKAKAKRSQAKQAT